MTVSGEAAFRPCALIPHFNHPRTLGGVCAGLAHHGLDCLVVDDGSDAAARRAAQALHGPPGVRVVLLPGNAGKGAAFQAGLQMAGRLGYTHVLQIDADGQQDMAAVPDLLATARDTPGAVVTGYAVFDASVPRIRYYGRYLTHAMVWLNTLSLDIRDSMCGLRVYPVADTLRLMRRHAVGRRMDFDTDVLVRLHWAGVRVCNRPVRVNYPADGVSHFRLWGDNARLTLMHTRHFLGMWLRLPGLLARNLRRAFAPSPRRPAP